jgi:hypothetical protein
MSKPARADHAAATTADEAVQLRLARYGDTEQRELLRANPNLTVATLTWIVANWTFSPHHASEFRAHPNMTPTLARRIRSW